VRSSRVATVVVLVALAAGVRHGEARIGLNLRISTGAVERLAVGETLQLRAFLARWWWNGGLPPNGPPPPLQPLDVPLLWSVEPQDRAEITADGGLLTAVRPGEVTVRVSDPRRPFGRSPLYIGGPGSQTLTIVQHVDGGRLPRLGATAKGVEELRLRWSGTGLVAQLSTLLEDGEITVTGSVPTAFPWGAPGDPEGTWFERDPCTCVRLTDRRGGVKTSRLTIESWKDGVAVGRFVMTTSRGVDFDFTFIAPLEDPDGSLGRASHPKAPR
jgi:hypothetical protein